MRGWMRLAAIGCGLAVPMSLVGGAPSKANVPDAEPFSIAQTPTNPDPNDDRFLQNPPPVSPIPPSEEPPLVPQPTPTPAPSPPETIPPESNLRIPVQRIEVVGSTIFSAADLAPITDPAVGQSLTVEELNQIADRITQLYLNGGYITSRAVLVEQAVANGVVQIQVIEGALENIEIEGNQRVNDAYIRSRVALGGRTPLNQGRLEDQLRLLRIDPLFENVEASLRAGSGLGQSILTVRVTEANPLVSRFSIDNFSPPSVGSERFGIGLAFRNVTGLGDQLSASYDRSTTGGSNVFDFNYRVPINPMNGTIELRVAPSTYRITNAPPGLSGFDIEGNSELYEVSYRQPLVRSPRQEFALSLGFTYRTGETLVNDTLADENTTSVIKFGQDFVNRDPQGAWAVRSQFNLGTGLLDATSGSEPDGQFLSWLGQLQRVQILDQSNLLIAQLDVQLALDPLVPSQQFVIGGGQSLRGFRQNARLGDSGFRFSIEDRITIQRNESGAPILQLAPFFDMGAVWNHDDNPNPLADQTFLAGVGVGLLWEPLPRLNVRVDYALPLIDLDDRGENAQDEAFYFSVNYQP